MTLEGIDKLEAGRELDALVAEKVMGWKQLSSRSMPENPGFAMTTQQLERWMEPRGYVSMDLPSYSTSISAAWEVVEKLNSLGYKVLIVMDYDGDCEQIRLTAGDDNCPHQKPYDPKDGHGYTEIDVDPIDSIKASLAICRVALKAVNDSRKN